MLVTLLLAGCSVNLLEPEVEQDVDAQAETDPDGEPETEPAREAEDAGPEPDAEVTPEAELAPEPEHEAEGAHESDDVTPEPEVPEDADAETPPEAEADAEATAEPEIEAEAEPGDLEPEPDPTEAVDGEGAEAEASELEAREPEDEGEIAYEFEPDPRCPANMVLLPADPDLGVTDDVCIDRYEASRDDATDTQQGEATHIAHSRPGVMPWFETPITLAHLDTFEAACAAAGKRLCRKAEWFSACTGPARNRYVFGDDFDAERCNSVDACCRAFCAELGIDPCDTDSNCGYRYSCYRMVPTARFPGCRNAVDALDVNGNVWEVVRSTEDPRGFEVRGGAFNCASPAVRLECSYNATWTSLFAGFRCCGDPLP